MNNELKQYIKRRRQGQMVRVGVMYAQVMPDGFGGVAIGFSLCSKSDTFCPEVADDIAFDRSIAYVERAPYFRKLVDTTNGIDELRQYVDVKGIRMRQNDQHTVEVVKNLFPDSIATDLAVFIGRVERFFKEYILPEWASLYYADHKDLVDTFFVKLEKQKAAKQAGKEVIANG